MEKTNPESCQETAEAASSVEMQKPAGKPGTNPGKRIIAVIISALGVLSFETPWLMNQPTALRLSLLLLAAVAVGLFFGCGLTAPDKKAKEGGEDKDISGWAFAVSYLIIVVAAGLIYALCPSSRINGWLFVLIDLGEAVVCGLLGLFFFCLIAAGNVKAAAAVGILTTAAVAAGTVYFGWPCLRIPCDPAPVMAVLLPGIAFAGSVLSGLLGKFFIALIMFAGKDKRIWLSNVIGTLIAAAAAACMLYFGWPCLRDGSSPVMAMLLPGFVLGGSALAGVLGIVASLPAALKKSFFDGFRTKSSKN